MAWLKISIFFFFFQFKNVGGDNQTSYVSEHDHGSTCLLRTNDKRSLNDGKPYVLPQILLSHSIIQPYQNISVN